MSIWYLSAGATAGSQDGTSLANAWTSISGMNQSSLVANDIVYVYSGYYNGIGTLTKGGTSTGARITYKGVSGSGQLNPQFAALTASNIHNISLIGLEFTQTGVTDNTTAINMAGCSGWLIQDCYIHDVWGAGVDARVNTFNNANIIRSNVFTNVNGISGGSGSSYAISVNGNSNLIEYNQIYSGLDRVRAFGTGNVIRNNYFAATNTAPYPNSIPYPYHTDAFQSFNGAGSFNLYQTLFDRNWDIDNIDSIGGTNAHHFIIQDTQTSPTIGWTIMRFDAAIRMGGPYAIFDGLQNTYGYNITAVAMNSGAPNLFRNTVNFDSANTGTSQSSGSEWINNTWSLSPRSVDNSGVWGSNRGFGFTGDYNHSYNQGTSSALPPWPHNLAHVDPLFQAAPDVNGNFTGYDITLRVNSPLTGAGGPIVFASGAGINSYQITVTNTSKKLCDGWGIVDADWIKISGASNSYVQISGIDYINDIVTVLSPQTWNNGDGIYVKGSEDVGAQPYKYALPLFVANTTSGVIPSGVTGLLSATGNSDCIRKVEFFVDGMPMGHSYTNPYSVQWVGDGSGHQVAARAYNMWASETLWVADTITIAATGNVQPSGVLTYRRLGAHPKFSVLSYY